MIDVIYGPAIHAVKEIIKNQNMNHPVKPSFASQSAQPNYDIGAQIRAQSGQFTKLDVPRTNQMEEQFKAYENALSNAESLAAALEERLEGYLSVSLDPKRELISAKPEPMVPRANWLYDLNDRLYRLGEKLSSVRVRFEG